MLTWPRMQGSRSPDPERDDGGATFGPSQAENQGQLVGLIGYAVPLAIGLAVLFHSVTRLGVGSPSVPGPGFWPVILSVVLAVSSGALLLTEAPEWPREAFTRHAADVALALVAVGVFIILLERAGTFVAGAFLMLVWTRRLGREGWTLSIVVSTATSATVSAVFIGALGIPLPALPPAT
jgi:hypothetical protein